MSVLVYIENRNGEFKKQSFELLSYGYNIAQSLNCPLVAISIGQVKDEAFNSAARYGASKIISYADNNLKGIDNQVYTDVICQIAEKEGAQVVLLANTSTGKAIAPRISVRMKAGLVSGAMKLPSSFDPFMVERKVYNGGALSNTIVKTAVKIITLNPNAFELLENPCDLNIERAEITVDGGFYNTNITDVKKTEGKILLTEADIVVSGGRGMKSGDNWQPIEELAELLGAATACSRPVSDEGWRPHEEHVGQTGKVIAPNVYFALGISGAIQHIAGVSSSKFIVAINKDNEAPVFETADYGIVGDVQEVLPRFIESIKKYKATL